MADALTIDFAVTNLSRVEQAFKRMETLSSAADTRLAALASRADEAAAAYSRLNTQIALFNRLSGSGGGFGPAIPVQSRPAGSSPAASPSSSPAARGSFVSGPLQRQEKLAQQFSLAQSQGNRRAAVDIRLAQIKNDAHLQRLTAPEKTLGGKFLDVLKTSRFGVGAGGKMEMMPLVGRTASLAAEALGPEVMALAGPVGIVVGAVTAAAAAVFNLAKGAAAADAAMTSFQFSVGNMGAGSSAALAAGRQGGLSADATAGQANALQNAITGSSTGRMYGMSLGVTNLAGPYGSQDYATQYKTAVDALRRMPIEQRILTARQTGLEASLPATMTSDKQYALSQKDAGVQAKIFDPAFAEKSADFNAALGRLEDAGTNLMTALGKPFLDSLTLFFNSLATGINNMAAFFNSPTGQIVEKALLGAGGVAMDIFGGNGQTAQTQATQDNTKALHSLSNRMDNTYGNDADGRLRAALPGAGKASADIRQENRLALAGGAIRLSAF